MKVIIAGAGPVGSVAALSAIKKGHEVEVFEEHQCSGYPQHCSGLISKEGVDSLSDLVDYTPFILNRINGAIFDFAGEEFVIDRKVETAYVIDRAEFDQALAHKAEEEGAKIRYGKRFSPNQNYRGNAIIGADGALSAVAHHFKFPRISTFAFTLKTKARMERIEEPYKVRLFYYNSVFPGFFGWLIPHNEYEAEIGLGTTNQRFIKRGFDFLIKKLDPISFEKPRGKIIPISQRKKIGGVFGSTNVLLAGDAAGQVKSSSGGGIVYGTLGGRLAGSLVHAPLEYERSFREQNSKDLFAHMFLRNFFAFQPDLGLKIIAMVSKALGLDSLFALYGNMDRPTRIFSTPFFRLFKSKAPDPELNHI